FKAQGSIDVKDDLATSEIKRLERQFEAPAILNENQSRRDQRRSVSKFFVITARQCIGDRYRYNRHTHRQSTKDQDGLVDRITRQDHDWTIEPQPAIEQRLANSIGDATHFTISNPPPSAIAVPLREH